MYIEYNLNGGTVTGNPNSYTVNTDTITLKNPSKTGYTFTGWTGSNGSVAQTTVTIPKGSTGNKSYTANYKINTYTVNVTVTNGTITGSTSKTVNHGSSTTFTVNPSSGYGSPTITCTNSQKGSLNASTLTVSSVTNGTTCTVAFKQLTASEYIVEQKDDYSDSDIIKISQPSTVQTPALTEYRYSGSDVDNYVTFNNETWRIIGVFQVDNGSGTYEERIKLIRDDSIGNYSWDTSASTINSGYGINQWGVTGSYNGADLMKLLNTGPYYNRTSGTCYAGKNNATKSCSFTTTGLNSTAKNMIGDAKWYTAASNFEDVTSKVSYEEERGNVVGETDTGISMTKRTNWIGSIGLIYPSDYGYASSGCGNGEYVLFEYDNSTCKSTNWLSDNISQYLLAPATGGADRVRYISSEGYVGRTITHNGYGVRPSVYLLSSVKITGGNGTSSDPYELSL